MPRYWALAPFQSEDPSLFEKVWEFDLANNVISIGWDQLGDISAMGHEQISEAIAATFPDKNRGAQSRLANMLWAFYHEITPGDFVLARRGRKILTAVGKVTRSAVYAPGRNVNLTSPGRAHSNFIEVEWLDHPRDKTYPNIVFPMHTLSKLSVEQYQNLLEGSATQIVTLEEPELVEDTNEFILERYLEDFIVSNFDAIFKGRLKIYEDADGADGQQFTTDIGPIDILAVEPESNSFIVIELKKGRPSDKVVGQILRYMGWVKRNLCTESQEVRGLIVCRDPDKKLTYALEMTNNIDVRYYSVSFKLSEAP